MKTVSLQQVCRAGFMLNNVATSGGFSCLHSKVCCFCSLLFLFQCSLDVKVVFFLLSRKFKMHKLSSSPDFCLTIEIPLKFPLNLILFKVLLVLTAHPFVVWSMFLKTPLHTYS